MLAHSRSILPKSIRTSLHRMHSKPKAIPLCDATYNIQSCLFSTNEKEFVISKIDPEIPSIANIILNRPPVNSLSLEMCVAIKEEITKVQKNPNISSIILSSSNPKIYSAGLDIPKELYNPDPDRLISFWKSFQDLFISLYLSKASTIAALDGIAVAGGCMIAMSCDYRIMGDKSGGIGLNETMLGIAAPKWMAELMVRTIGFRQSELALARGTIFKPMDALQIGLVDQVIVNDDIMKKAREQAIIYSKISNEARVVSKLNLRQKYVDEFWRSRDEDLNFFCKFILNDQVQETIGLYLQSLKKKK